MPLFGQFLNAAFRGFGLFSPTDSFSSGQETANRGSDFLWRFVGSEAVGGPECPNTQKSVKTDTHTFTHARTHTQLHTHTHTHTHKHTQSESRNLSSMSLNVIKL